MLKRRYQVDAYVEKLVLCGEAEAGAIFYAALESLKSAAPAVYREIEEAFNLAVVIASERAFLAGVEVGLNPLSVLATTDEGGGNARR